MLKGIQRGNQGAMRWSWVGLGGAGWRAPAARFLHQSTHTKLAHLPLYYSFRPNYGRSVPPASSVKSIPRRYFTYCALQRATLQIKSSQLCINGFGYSVWFLLSLLGVSSGSAERKKGELICLLRLSKHVWDADKNTQEANAPRDDETTYSPVGPPDQVSSGLRLSRAPPLCVPLIFLCCLCQPFSFLTFFFCLFQFNHFKAGKGNDCASFG